MEHLTLFMLTCFFVKHFICDFPIQIQPPWMFLNKGTYGHIGGIAHALVHVAASSLILVGFSIAGTFDVDQAHGLNEMQVVVIILWFEFAVHYHMDWFKMWWCKRQGYKADTHPQFWFWLGIDQFVHYMTYIVMVWAWI